MKLASVLQRMRELTVQSLNDTITDADRFMLQDEFRALQLELGKFTEESEWNTMPLFEKHLESFHSFRGNQTFQDLVRITEGFNNDLEIVVEGVSYHLSVDEGYYSINKLLDVLDTKLMELNPNIIIGLTENNQVTLQAENCLSIDYIKGGLSFLFYEYVQGTPPGMILGVTEFSEAGKLEIISGSNDRLNFYVGSDKQYTIKFTPKSGGYTIDELITIINTQLQEQGETEVEAIKYNDKYIALYSDKYVITGLSGNIIKIDGITSVLYDNAKYGTVAKTNAYITGAADLSDGITIRAGVNDTLRIYINQSKTQIIKLLDSGETEKFYTLVELVAKLNGELEERELEAFFSTTTSAEGTHLKLESKVFGSKSRITVYSDSNAYEDLFQGFDVVAATPTFHTGYSYTAEVTGRYGISDNTEILAGLNDTLTFNVTSTKDGKTETVTKSITLEEGNYSKEELIEEINSKLSGQGINLTVRLSSGISGQGNQALIFTHTLAGEGNSFQILSTANAYVTLLCEEYTVLPTYIPGKTELIYSPEGVVAPPEEVKTPAIYTGKADLGSGIIIDSTNNLLNFNVSGHDVNINLQEGSYDAINFLNMLSEKLEGTGVVASLVSGQGYGTNLVLKTEAAGNNQYFSDVGGSSFSTLFTSKGIVNPYRNMDQGTSSASYVLGRYEVPENFRIDSTNKELNFDYTHGDETYTLSLNLTEGVYSSISSLIDELNEKIREELARLGFHVAEDKDADIFATSYSNRVRINAKNSGKQYKFSNFSGGFYENLFARTVITRNPSYNQYGSSNSADNQLAYIVGREDLNKEITIHPNVNDTLIFDFHHNTIKETFQIKIDPGVYTENIVTEIQNKLREELISKGYAEDLLQVQLGGVDSGTASNDDNKLVIKHVPKDDGSNNNGTYIIDGVRGSGAYTVFYKAHGEPSPTHTIGIADLSNGAHIQTGINDTLSMDLNGVEITIVLDQGVYNSEELLEQINSKLEAAKANIVASYYEGRLKLSFLEVGANTIDGIRGNAKDTLFFISESRASDTPKYFQVGPNKGDKIDFAKVRISGELMRINTIMIHTSEHAKKALGRIDNGINYLVQARSSVGAMQNRLQSIIRSNENYEENLTAAETRIRDADMAKEMMEFTKNRILQQAAQAMLAQANQQQQGVLKLLS